MDITVGKVSTLQRIARQERRLRRNLKENVEPVVHCWSPLSLCLLCHQEHQHPYRPKLIRIQHNNQQSTHQSSISLCKLLEWKKGYNDLPTELWMDPFLINIQVSVLVEPQLKTKLTSHLRQPPTQVWQDQKVLKDLHSWLVTYSNSQLC